MTLVYKKHDENRKYFMYKIKEKIVHSTYLHLISIISAEHSIHLGFKASYTVSINRSYGNGRSRIFCFPYLRRDLAKKTFSLVCTHSEGSKTTLSKAE